MKLSLAVIQAVFLIFSLFGFQFAAHADESEIATNLTTLLRSARAVTVNTEKIADPSKFDVDAFLEKTRKNYLRASGKKLDKSDPVLGKLMQTMELVITDAKAGKYQNKWDSGKYAHKFLPARFAREAGLKLKELTNGKVILKLTTSNALLVNPANKADSWENNVIESKFLSKDWPKDAVVTEKTGEGFRLILPEYYQSGCLGCHGGEEGKSIHAQPVAGNLGDFGGAISVILK